MVAMATIMFLTRLGTSAIILIDVDRRSVGGDNGIVGNSLVN
jgi:hypothetical protein